MKITEDELLNKLRDGEELICIQETRSLKMLLHVSILASGSRSYNIDTAYIDKNRQEHIYNTQVTFTVYPKKCVSFNTYTSAGAYAKLPCAGEKNLKVIGDVLYKLHMKA